MKIGYLGPEGTFSQLAAEKYAADKNNAEFVAFSSIAAVLSAVEAGDIDEGVVPFENSIEGTVNYTIDSLVFDVDLEIKSEVVIPISHNLAARKESAGKKPLKILSHPQSLAQCKKYLEKNYKDSDTVQVSSNSEAARVVASTDEPWYCITTRAAAEIYGLEIMDSGIQDEKHNETRFIAVGSKNEEKKSYVGKTSIVFSTENKPGELYRVLDIISIWDLNMTKIESRPMKNQLGTYVFFVDLECENPDDMRDALKMIKRKTTFFKHLGTYATIN